MILWRQNPKVHHRIHNSAPTNPILSQVNPFHTPPPQLISLSSILIPFSHLRLGLPSGLFPSGIPTKTLCSFLYSSMRVTCPTQQVLLYLICLLVFGGWVQIMKFPTVRPSPFSRYFIPFRFKYSLQHPVLELYVTNLLSIFRCLACAKESILVWGASKLFDRVKIVVKWFEWTNIYQCLEHLIGWSAWLGESKVGGACSTCGELYVADIQLIPAQYSTVNGLMSTHKCCNRFLSMYWDFHNLLLPHVSV
jgi:hypothetical protein